MTKKESTTSTGERDFRFDIGRRDSEGEDKEEAETDCTCHTYVQVVLEGATSA